MALLTNTPTQADSLLHSMDQAANDIALHVNAEKAVFLYLNKLEMVVLWN